MIPIQIDGIQYSLKSGLTVLEACKHAGITIPRFCYHETLSIAGNCRMCLVEIEGIEKPVASCLTEISTNIFIHTNSLFVKKARENVLETLLVNHPLDCPICDQAGECDLQDQAKSFGTDSRRFFFNKRGVEDKDCGPFIKTIMTRCIHCTRCVRFGSEIAGLDALGTLNRGTSTEIGGYISTFLNSEISGNVIDLCPVGALNSKPSLFTTRPWELRVNESIDTTDSTCSNIYINSKDFNIARILPRNNELINQNLISDKIRFSYDSNHLNRITHFDFLDSETQWVEKNSIKNIRKINTWTNLLQNIKNILFLDKKQKLSYFFVDESIGLESLQLLKQCENQFNIEVYSPNSNLTRSNSYFYGLNDTIKDIHLCNNICLFLSLNPKIECSVINSRLKMIYKNTLINILSLNLFFDYNNPITYMHLNYLRSFDLFEGKYSSFSNSLIHSIYPLLLLSDSFNKRTTIFYSEFLFSLKSTFNTLINLKINSTSNKESLEYLNVENVSYENVYNNLLSTNNINTAFSFNLDDNFSFSKHCSYYSSTSIKPLNNSPFFEFFYRFNSHYVLYPNQDQNTLFIPTLSEFEDQAIFLNLESRPQKTSKCFPNFYDARSSKTILNAIFDKTNKHSFSSAFFYEMIENPSLFDKIDKKFSNLSLQFFIQNNNFLYHYPNKVNLQDSSISNRITKHSKSMQECSRLLRLRSTNFSILSFK